MCRGTPWRSFMEIEVIITRVNVPVFLPPYEAGCGTHELVTPL